MHTGDNGRKRCLGKIGSRFDTFAASMTLLPRRTVRGAPLCSTGPEPCCDIGLTFVTLADVACGKKNAMVENPS